ncbi:MAG TPA: DUF1360 domain-containing protein [Actinophytocola sp.]|uniref:DUF1360 domain-containing protein n=1 Tax=Actinophytocola sp. TaxID=1872138 RepID=UPI002F92D230
MTKTIQTEASPSANGRPDTQRTGTERTGTRTGMLRGRFSRLVRRVQRAYADGHNRPLAGYTVVLGGYSALLGLLTGIGRATGTRLPERVGVQDTVLLCLATHKASRLLAKDAVTSPLRAPFARYEEPAGEAELNESVRGSGVQHAVGELITCPFCLGVWVASGLTAGLVFAPRPTRLVLTALTAIATSDTIQLVYDGAKKRLAN